MNPHELQQIETRGRFRGMTFTWWCSCGYRGTGFHEGKRTGKAEDWAETTVRVFTDHRDHAYESANGLAPYSLNRQCPCTEGETGGRCPLVQGHGGECFQ